MPMARTAHTSRLTLVGDVIKTDKKALYKCACGTQRMLDRRKVKSGHTRSCGCLRKETTREGALRRELPNNMQLGARYGALVALRLVSRNPVRWLFRCDCGKEKTVRGYEVRHGRTHSCGCGLASKTLTVRAGIIAKSYGVTLEDASLLAIRTEGTCDCCGLPEPRKKRLLSVDHCHAKGGVRGVLCSPCNLVLGFVEKYPDRFGPLTAYFASYLKLNQ